MVWSVDNYSYSDTWQTYNHIIEKWHMIVIWYGDVLVIQIQELYGILQYNRGYTHYVIWKPRLKIFKNCSIVNQPSGYLIKQHPRNNNRHDITHHQCWNGICYYGLLSDIWWITHVIQSNQLNVVVIVYCLAHTLSCYSGINELHTVASQSKVGGIKCAWYHQHLIAYKWF